VYPAGILVKPVLLPESVILTSEISNLSISKHDFFQRAIRIEHHTPALIGPLDLFTSPASNIARAIEQISGQTFPHETPNLT
jgi:hypothetical protein